MSDSEIEPGVTNAEEAEASPPLPADERADAVLMEGAAQLAQLQPQGPVLDSADPTLVASLAAALAPHLDAFKMRMLAEVEGVISGLARELADLRAQGRQPPNAPPVGALMAPPLAGDALAAPAAAAAPPAPIVAHLAPPGANPQAPGAAPPPRPPPGPPPPATATAAAAAGAAARAAARAAAGGGRRPARGSPARQPLGGEDAVRAGRNAGLTPRPLDAAAVVPLCWRPCWTRPSFRRAPGGRSDGAGFDC